MYKYVQYIGGVAEFGQREVSRWLTHTHTHTHKHTHTHTHIHTYTHIHKHTYTYTYTHIHTHTHTHTLVLVNLRHCTHFPRHDSFTYIVWHEHTCGMTHSHVWHYPLICVPWCVHVDPPFRITEVVVKERETHERLKETCERFHRKRMMRDRSERDIWEIELKRTYERLNSKVTFESLNCKRLWEIESLISLFRKATLLFVT